MNIVEDLISGANDQIKELNRNIGFGWAKLNDENVYRLLKIADRIKEIRDFYFNQKIKELENAPEGDEQVENVDTSPMILTVSGYAQKLKISRHLVYKWARYGLIKLEKSGTKYTIVTNYPGANEGTFRFPSAEEFKNCGYRQPRVKPSVTRKRIQQN